MPTKVVRWQDDGSVATAASVPPPHRGPDPIVSASAFAFARCAVAGNPRPVEVRSSSFAGASHSQGDSHDEGDEDLIDEDELDESDQHSGLTSFSDRAASFSRSPVPLGATLAEGTGVLEEDNDGDDDLIDEDEYEERMKENVGQAAATASAVKEEEAEEVRPIQQQEYSSIATSCQLAGDRPIVSSNAGIEAFNLQENEGGDEDKEEEVKEQAVGETASSRASRLPSATRSTARATSFRTKDNAITGSSEDGWADQLYSSTADKGDDDDNDEDGDTGESGSNQAPKRRRITTLPCRAVWSPSQNGCADASSQAGGADRSGFSSTDGDDDEGGGDGTDENFGEDEESGLDEDEDNSIEESGKKSSRAPRNRGTKRSCSRALSRSGSNRSNRTSSKVSKAKEAGATSSRKASSRASSSAKAFIPKQLDEEKWQARYEKLRAYKEEHGDCLVPQRFAEDPSLGRWVNRQKIQWRKLKKSEHANKTKERIELLENGGFVFDPKKEGVSNEGNKFQPDDEAWDKHFRALLDYKKQHGDCLVPTKGYAENQSLGNWLVFQRRQYKLRQQNKPSQITDDRVERLERIGFVWREKREWGQQFEALCDYKERHGDCLVPRCYPENQSLRIWVNTQRRQHSLRQQNKPSQITDDRVDRLEGIGFVWRTKEGVPKGVLQSGDERWGQQFEALCDYKERHGDFRVPRRCPENQSLGHWVHTQRKQYKLRQQNKPSPITDDRIERLENNGFVWASLKKLKRQAAT